ncbi:BON domain-containing protein [Oxalobacteraceae bacterium OM1]|nr:BON domain-containing protein [Oxalobacteraceae bacterium OM1]
MHPTPRSTEMPEHRSPWQAKYHSLLASMHASLLRDGVIRLWRPGRQLTSPDETTADQQLRNDVNDELRCDPALHTHSVVVEADKGLVTLTGSAEDQHENALIEAAAWRIAGVTSLSNRLRLAEPSTCAPQDEDIRQASEDVLNTPGLLSGHAIAVSVSAGWVMLTGNVARGEQRSKAEEAISRVPGVRGINGQITVRPAVMEEQIRAKIVAALGDTRTPQWPRIHLVVSRRHVLVAGFVFSLGQHRAVINAVRSCEGVQQVIDEIQLTDA